MSWLATIGVALITGALGLAAAGLIANASVAWYRISSFEGLSGYFVVATALGGSLVGGAIGVVTSRIIAHSAAPGFLKALGLGSLITLGFSGVAALTAWKLGDIPPRLGGRELDLAVEIRLPAGDPRPDSTAEGAGLSLESIVRHRMRKRQAGELQPADSRQENGRWIVPGSVFVFTQRGLRGISVELRGRPAAGFIVPLPARPGAEYEQWSDWGPRPPAGQPPWPDSKASYRFRVVRRVPE